LASQHLQDLVRTVQWAEIHPCRRPISRYPSRQRLPRPIIAQPWKGTVSRRIYLDIPRRWRAWRTELDLGCIRGLTRTQISGRQIPVSESPV